MFCCRPEETDHLVLLVIIGWIRKQNGNGFLRNACWQFVTADAAVTYRNTLIQPWVVGVMCYYIVCIVGWSRRISDINIDLAWEGNLTFSAQPAGEQWVGLWTDSEVSPLVSFPSWTVCSGVHQAEDSWPLLDRPLSRWAGAAAPHPRRSRPPGLTLQAPSPGSRYLLCACFWDRAWADSKNSPKREIPQSGTAFLL